MLNIAGPEFDFGHVVYAVLQECEHRRRGLDAADFDDGIETCAREKLRQIKAAYDEFSGSKSYWEALEKEVLETVVPQYTEPARIITALERSAWNVFRGGDIAARFAFAFCGLVVGSIIVAIPWIPIFENMFAFALTIAAFFYPDIKRYFYERQFSKLLNRLVLESARYQDNARLSYMTRREIQESFEPGTKQITG
jgi:hypothetical protein